MRIFVVTIVLALCCRCSVYASGYPNVGGMERIGSDLDYLQTIIEEYKRQNEVYPSTANWKTELIDTYFLKDALKDPWGFEYHYALENGEYKIWSFGRDGLAGGIGEDFDFSNLTPQLNRKNRDLVMEKHNTIVLSIYALYFLFHVGVILLLVKIIWRKMNSNTPQ